MADRGAVANGSEIDRLRLSKDMTLPEAAESSGVSLSTWRRAIQSSPETPHRLLIHSLHDIAATLGVDFTDVVLARRSDGETSRNGQRTRKPPIVFCCYSRRDLTRARRVKRALESHGIEVWIDEDRIHVGDAIASSITEGLKRADFVLFVISKAAIGSKWVQYEIDQARKDQIDLGQPRILPIRLDDTPPPKLVEDLKWLNLWDNCFEDGIATLISSIDAHLSNRHKNSLKKIVQTINDDSRLSKERNLKVQELVHRVMRLKSWLPESRRKEICHAIEIIVGGGLLRQHRSDHLRAVARRSKRHRELAEIPAWVTLSPTGLPRNSKCGTRLALGFSNSGCEYRRKDPLNIGCFNCGFYAGMVSPVRRGLEGAMLRQFEHALEHAFFSGREYDVIEFLSDGSFLNDNEVPERTKRKLFEILCHMPNVRRVLLESTPEYVSSEEILERLDGLSDQQSLEIGIGMETADDFIRNACINKGTIIEDFETAVDNIARLPLEKRMRCGIVSYLLLKPALLRKTEAVEDVVKSIGYLAELSDRSGIRIVSKIEPTIVAAGTMLSLLMERGADLGLGEYHPPSYWLVLEVLSQATLGSASIGPIRIGGRNDMHEALRLPAIYEGKRFDQIDFLVYDALQEYNRHQDLLRVFAYLFAVLDLLDRDFMGYAEAFSRWQENWERQSGRDSAARSYYIENLTEIRELAGTFRDRAEANVFFAKNLYQALDFIEGHEPIPGESARTYLHQAREWAEILTKAEDRETDLSRVKGQVTKRLRSALVASGLKLTVPRVEEVFVEEYPHGSVRVRFQANDLITRSSFTVWAGIPV